MRHLKWVFWSSLGLIALLWLIAEPGLSNTRGFFTWRSLLVQLTGVLAIGCMSLGMLLALRPKWLERWLNGLDKMYRLHKWLGMGALVLSVLHWLAAKGPKWAVGWGWLVKPQKGPKAVQQPLEAFFYNQRGLAESLGEWAFYVAVIFIVLALIKRVPYRLFSQVHRLLAIIYLVLAMHSLALLKFSYWESPIGWLTGLLLVVGSWAAVISLLRRVGAQRRVPGSITGLHYYGGVKSLEIQTRVSGWPGHQPGQFAFASSNAKEGFHPYTIASSWDPNEPDITFVVKELGDHTRTLHERLTVAQPIILEGPYGCFTFDDPRPRQIWIGGGIGVTPFVARLKHLAAHPAANQPVDFFHSTAEVDEQALARLTEDVSSTDVRLHLLIDARDGYLTAERIRAAVPEWRNASIWFCGPAKFGEALRRDFAASGFPVHQHFHQELFEMR
ncbi:ferric reductase [Pseudomonas sp. G11-1]|uniref:Ferric reductase n=1 Tax=Halopseudomonas bauzanensis TaxID=653930 RepID=A0A4U0YP07_9GAMM|nr:ferric reductase [Pseudomonas sp. G11-1]MCO5788846.1 ferric reductase [Pseudomonas sp. G11-2]TKA90763.1 ferric reductase [Halopseudomonas bauzanensis]